ncbi:hypothetical protein [Streptomyces brevispora]|uniref:hypothetical protein n=1 Tax=Streptomyces brevispora TaxID=887462 RepID=UPI003819237E
MSAAAVRLGRDDGPTTEAGPEKTGLAQDVGGGALTARQIVEYLLADHILAIGVPDG